MGEVEAKLRWSNLEEELGSQNLEISSLTGEPPLRGRDCQLSVAAWGPWPSFPYTLMSAADQFMHSALVSSTRLCSGTLQFSSWVAQG